MSEVGHFLGDRCPFFAHVIQVQVSAWGSTGNKCEVVGGFKPGSVCMGQICFH